MVSTLSSSPRVRDCGGEWPHHAVKVSLMDGNKIAAQAGTWWYLDEAVSMTEKNLGQIMLLLLGSRKENTEGE